MKKLCVILLVLTCVGGVHAAVDENTVTDITFSPQVQGGLSSVDVGSIYYVDIFASSSTQPYLVDTGRLVVTISGTASFVENTDFNWALPRSTGPFVLKNFAYIDSQTLDIQMGYIGLADADAYLQLDAIAIGNFGINADAAGEVLISVTPTTTTNPWGIARYALDGLTAPLVDDEALGGYVTVEQVPEPMTLVMLGLGGLFLRRKKTVRRHRDS